MLVKYSLSTLTRLSLDMCFLNYRLTVIKFFSWGGEGEWFEVILSRNNSQNFERFVAKYQNTGHSVIDFGFNSCKIETPDRILSFWDSKIGTRSCSCRSKQNPEILLATSLIASDLEIVGAIDFNQVLRRIEHLAVFHKFSSVIGLGINSVTKEEVDFKRLHKIKQNFLNLLRLNEVAIGCRGLDTLEFLVKNGFKRSNLFVTGCPSLQLIKENQRLIPRHLSRIIVSGALINRLDLIESDRSRDSKILVIPQTLDSYINAVSVQKSNSNVEIFTPFSLRSWVNKLKTWKPDISMGTRLHGNITALSVGVPAVLMSGDTRAQEIATLAGLPFFEDVVTLDDSLARLESSSMRDISSKKSFLKSQIIACVNSKYR